MKIYNIHYLGFLPNMSDNDGCCLMWDYIITLICFLCRSPGEDGVPGLAKAVSKVTVKALQEVCYTSKWYVPTDQNTILRS